MTFEVFLENLSREIRRVQRMPRPAFAVFQVPTAQNNQYNKAAFSRKWHVLNFCSHTLGWHILLTRQYNVIVGNILFSD